MFRSAWSKIVGLSLMITGCGNTAGGVDIWEAVEQNDGAAVQKFIAAGGDANVQSMDGSTPLWVALTEKKRDSYEALLKYGADPNVIMSDKRVVTHWAATEQDPWWLRLALEHGADPNLVNVGSGRPSEGTPLHFAISKASLGDFKFLENIKLLVEHGADIDKPDHYDCYPLAQAASQNNFEIVLYLLEEGADYQLAERQGISFLSDVRIKVQNRNKWFRLEGDRKELDTVRAWLEARGVDVSSD